ncbi:MAG: hypothetical protein ACJ75R_03280 [Solirubrobacterales bacterium]
MSGRALIAAALAASALLAGAYLAAGGSDYQPTPVADPCQPRDWRSPDSVDEYAEQFFLSALDGAACQLHASRESLVVALATPENRSKFAAEHGISDTELEAAIRAGVERAIDDAQRAGAISPLIASGLRAVARELPVDEVISLISDAQSVFSGAGGILDQLGL